MTCTVALCLASFAIGSHTSHASRQRPVNEVALVSDAVQGVTGVTELAAPERISSDAFNAVVVKMPKTTDKVVAARIPGSQFNKPSRVVVETPEITVSVPKDARKRIALSNGTNRLEIGIPSEAQADEAAVPVAGTAVFTYRDLPIATAVHVTSDGGVRQAYVLEKSSAQQKFQIPISLPTGYHLKLQADQTIRVQGADPDEVLGTFERPWAYDSNRKVLPTRYTISGNSIVQTIDTSGARFPVMADPKYTWGIASGTIYFNRSETGRMRIPSGVTALAAGLGASIASGPFAPIVMAFMAFMAFLAGTISLVASTAYGDGGCIKFKLVPPQSVLPQTYSGGYCK
jgi:hypothetical protein